MFLFLTLALHNLNTHLFIDLALSIYGLLPLLLALILIMILAVVGVDLVVNLFERALSSIGVGSFLKDMNQTAFLHTMLAFLRIVLYMFIFFLALDYFKVESGLTSLVLFILYTTIIVGVIMVILGTKSFVENYASYLQMTITNTFRVGQLVKLDDTEGTIEEISPRGVVIKTDDGFTSVIPVSRFASEIVGVKKHKIDVQSLTKLQQVFVAQKPSWCGPAAAAMILKIFGFPITQEGIGNACGAKENVGTAPQVLIDAVEKLTNKDVRGAWIDVDHINNLTEELSEWLSDGALIIIDFKKNVLFPQSKRAHYAVCLAIENNNLLLLDPSSIKGGVYFANPLLIYKGMDTFSELFQGKRGYIVFVPSDTVGYHRIANNRVFPPEKPLFKKIGTHITRKSIEAPKLLENIMPTRVRDALRSIAEKEKIDRVWRPEPRK
nr:hypothetical protein [uncultured archaeon]